MDKEIDTFIDVLHALRAERAHSGSGVATQEAADRLIANMIAGSKNLGGGAPSLASEIASRILEAEKNWDRQTGTSHCGAMTPPQDIRAISGQTHRETEEERQKREIAEIEHEPGQRPYPSNFHLPSQEGYNRSYKRDDS